MVEVRIICEEKKREERRRLIEGDKRQRHFPFSRIFQCETIVLSVL